MAFYRKNKFGKNKNQYTETEKIAYHLGRVKKGLQNPDSKISESYRNGCSSANKTKKSMF